MSLLLSTDTVHKKSELHLLSIGLLVVALIIVALHFISDSLKFGFTTTIIIWIGTIVGMSERWKDASDKFHITVIVCSLIVMISVVIFNLLSSKKDS